MTRETKIGLLVGLGFIVVFAVLLSHTHPVLPAGDDLDLVIAERGEPAGGLLDGTVGSSTVFPDGVVDHGAGPVGSSSPDGTDARSGSEEVWHQPLPRPGALDPRPGDGDFSSAGADATRLTKTSPTEGDPGRIVEIFRRVAPPRMGSVDTPEPMARPGLPEQSREPEPAADPGPTAPPVQVVTPKEYVVQKGDSLGKIAKAHYDTAAARVVDFLARSNKGRIKNKDLVIEGQKLLIPALPAEMVEPVGDFGPAKVNAVVRLVRGDELIRKDESDKRGEERRAPKPALQLTAGGDRADPGTDRSGDAFHWYVVRPKDTLISIARKQLGSSERWHEIQSLNRQVKPTKMKPGDRIRLPSRRPLSEVTESGRASA